MAQTLLDKCVVEEGGRRFAAMNGIAFEARATGDGTWHGFPIPWDDVPADAQDRLLTEQQATKRDIRRQNIDKRDLRWALNSDEE